MSRTTKSEVRGTFDRFVKAIGGRVAESYDDVGGYFLDFEPAYGGYKVTFVQPDGGLGEPLGSRRRSAGEMWATLAFAIDAIGLAEEAHLYVVRRGRDVNFPYEVWQGGRYVEAYTDWGLAEAVADRLNGIITTDGTTEADEMISAALTKERSR